MTALGRWLAGILNAHIERDNVPTTVEYTLPSGQRIVDQLQPVPEELLDRPLARHYIGVLDLEEAPTAAVRPCWVCSYEGGFYAQHKCDSHFDTTGGAARRAPAPSPPPIQVVGIDYGFPSASSWRRT